VVTIAFILTKNKQLLTSNMVEIEGANHSVYISHAKEVAQLIIAAAKGNIQAKAKSNY
jgi:hypothetical protein